MKKIAAVHFDNNVNSLLDHIVPLSHLLNIPIYFQEDTLFNLAKKYYPQAKILFKEHITYAYLAKNYDALFSCDYWLSKDKISFEILHKKTMKLVFCPHGNSDKGYIVKDKMQAYALQDMVLLYGNHMINLLKKLNVFKNLKQYVVVGNFRLSFYKKYKKFYDNLTYKLIFSKLNLKNKTILYAPTWKDLENSSSYFEIFEKLINNIPKHYNLIIKPHPNLEIKNPVEFYKLYNEKLPKNILLLHEFPLIYPLLNKCDIYLGDFSSIGYDFLYFQKPMFFIDHLQRDSTNNPSLFLHRCGHSIEKKYWNDIFSFIDTHLNLKYKQIQKKNYAFTYGEEKKISEIKKAILLNL